MAVEVKRGSAALFSVTVPLDGAETLGAAMRDQTGGETGIRIEHIVPGPIQRWNVAHLDRAVRVGDFIVRAGDRPIASGRRIVEFARGDSLQLTIRRGGCLPTAKIRKVERSLAALQRVTTCVDGVLGENRGTCDGTSIDTVTTDVVVGSLKCDASASANGPTAKERFETLSPPHTRFRALLPATHTPTTLSLTGKVEALGLDASGRR